MIYTKFDYNAILKTKKKLKWKHAMIASMWERSRPQNERKKLYKSPRKARNSHRNRGYAIEEMINLKENHPQLFERMFRLDCASFDELVEILDPVLKKNEDFAIRSSGSPIRTETRLAVTLRWLSGGSYIDICFAWGISKSSFYSDHGVLWPTISALDQVLKLGVPLENTEALEE